MYEGKILIGVIIGILSYSCLYLGKGIQKLGINRIKAAGSIRKKASGIWILGTVLTVIPMFIQWVALVYAPVNLIAPLEGLGLIVLALFSYFALKEKISAVEAIGIGMIVVGTFLTAFFARPSAEVAISQFRPYVFMWILFGIVLVEGLSILISSRKQYRYAGFLLGFTAGTMMAFQSISKRLSVIEETRIAGIILTMVFAVLTLVITQIGFAKSTASQVVSSFTSASILVASVVSVFVLNENIMGLQYLGISIIVLGIPFLTVFDSLNIKKIQWRREC